MKRTGSAGLLASDSLLWPAGDSAVQNVSVHLTGQLAAAQQLSTIAIMVGNVTNADLAVDQSTTLISNIPHANLTTGFVMVPNQVSSVCFSQAHAV